MIKQRGFTLIEMALVIAIIGVMVGGGLMATGPIIQQAHINQTNAAMDQIESALVLFVIRNNRLPCPADGSLTNTNANYGLEVGQTNTGAATDQCNMADFNGAATTTNAVIPWVTLGLDETYSLDGWNNRISYFPANPMIGGVATLVDNSGTNCLNRISSTSPPPQGFRGSTACDTTSTGITPTALSTCSSSCYGAAYGVPTYPFGNYIAIFSVTNTAVELTSANPGTNAQAAAGEGSPDYVGLYGQRAAYVLISHGPSGWYGWTRAGTQTPPPNIGINYALKLNNSGVVADMVNNAGFVQGLPQNTSSPTSNAGGANAAKFFDDIVRWRSPAFIIQQCGSGACGNP